MVRHERLAGAPAVPVSARRLRRRRVLQHAHVLDRHERAARDHLVEDRQQPIDVRLIVDDLDSASDPELENIIVGTFGTKLTF